MAGEIIQKSTPRQPGTHRRKRRLGVRIDLASITSLAFILLIVFLIMTGSIKRKFEPRVMEISIPPLGVSIQATNQLTIRVDAEGRFWWNVSHAGTENPPQLLPTHPQTPAPLTYRLNPDTLYGLLYSFAQQHHDDLNVELIIHREAHYEDWVDILDEIQLLKRALSKYGFSCRYSMHPWSEKDDRMIQDALQQTSRAGVLK